MITAVVARRPILRSVSGVLMRVSERNNHYSRHVFGPPRVRVSFPEKVAHGIAIFVACGAVPLWVSLKIKDYRGEDEETED